MRNEDSAVIQRGQRSSSATSQPPPRSGGTHLLPFPATAGLTTVVACQMSPPTEGASGALPSMHGDAPMNALANDLESHLAALGSALDDLSEARRVPRGLRSGLSETIPDLSGWNVSLSRLYNSIAEESKQGAFGVASELEKEGRDPLDLKAAKRLFRSDKEPNISLPFSPTARTLSLTLEDRLLPPEWLLPNPDSRCTVPALTLLVRSAKRSDNDVRLRFWLPSRSDTSRPAALHVVVDRTLQVFLVLRYSSEEEDANITVERVTCLAPHEAKPPYADSDFSLYQSISRYFSVLLAMQPDLSPASLLDILITYQTLFRDKCGLCGTELSGDAREPPVGRVWKQVEGPETGLRTRAWLPRHIQCMAALL